jgi:predicted porin
MKKVLLTTTALGLFAAGSAFAAGPVVTVGGSADFQVGAGSQEGVYKTQGANDTYFTRDYHSRTDTTLHIKADGKADNGLGYGAYIELNADVNSNDTSAQNNANARKTYLYVETGFGRVEAGATGDAGNALKVDASTFARATGGIGGDYYKYVDLSGDSALHNNVYYVLPGLPTAAGLPGETAPGVANGDTHLDRATANKVSYYSPRIQGFQAGVSFTPDQDERGTASSFSGNNVTAPDAGHFVDVFNGGLNYQAEFNNFGINASITGETGTAKDDASNTTNYDDLQAYAAGLSLSYAGFTLGGSYGDAPEYGQDSTFDSSLSYWTLGAAYEFGPFGTSVTYMDSTIEHQGALAAGDRELTNLSVGADYQLAPGLVPYVEVNFFDTDDNTAATVDNNGSVVIVGTQLNF